MIVIADYGVGNLTSIQNMFKRGGHRAEISGNVASLEAADKILLPGMGHFDNCMIRLKNSGLLPVIEKKVFVERVPLLGICVGLQMFMESSEEGAEQGLGWIAGKTIRFDQAKLGSTFKVPNMGWLDVHCVKPSSAWKGLDTNRFYFAHSFHVAPQDEKDILLTADYGYPFCVGIERDNIRGVQFHPEKSHRFGMQLLKNFAEL